MRIVSLITSLLTEFVRVESDFSKGAHYSVGGSSSLKELRVEKVMGLASPERLCC